MTKIILDGLEKNKFSIFAFWVKRVKRIIPALLFLIIIVINISFFYYLPNEFKDIEKNAISSLLFFSNIVYWKSSGYFAPASNRNLFLHTWSLSVEWQFYFIYPILLYLVFILFKKRRSIFIFLIVFAFLSFSMTLVLTPKSPVASFYLLPTRTWEMLLGSIALMIEGNFINRNKSIPIIAYLAIFISILTMSDRLIWPSAYTLIPTISTFVLIAINQNDYRILNYTFVQTIGKISYSLYLWHWPIIVLALETGFQLNIVVIIIIIALSFLIAYLSYKYIETIKFKSSLSIIILLGTLLIFIAMLGNIDANIKTKGSEMADWEKNHENEIKEQFNQDCCFVITDNIDAQEFNRFKNRDCLKIETNKKNFLLLGDSHAADLSYSLRSQLIKKHIKLLQATANGGGLPFLEPNGHVEYCKLLYQYCYFDFLVKNKTHIDCVILSANWVLNEQNATVKSLSQVIEYLNKLQIPVVIIGQTNLYQIPYPTIIARGMKINTNLTSIYTVKKASTLNNFLKQKLKSYYIDVYFEEESPKISPNNEPYEFDDNHLTKYGADIIAKRILSYKALVHIINK